MEVVLALTLFAIGALIVMGAVNSALGIAQRVQRDAQASDLAVSLLSEVQMGLVPLIDDGPNPYEDPALDGWTWEIVTESIDEPPTDVTLPVFEQVRVTVRYGEAYSYSLTELISEELLRPPPEEPVDEMGGI